MLIGEAPNEIEDNLGMAFQGETGALLNKMLLAIGILKEKFLIHFMTDQQIFYL